MAEIAGRCILQCGRKVATHSKTNICSSCLSNLAGWRRRPAADRMRYRQRLDLAGRRQEERDKFPKGYALGRFVHKQEK